MLSVLKVVQYATHCKNAHNANHFSVFKNPVASTTVERVSTKHKKLASSAAKAVLTVRIHYPAKNAQQDTYCTSLSVTSNVLQEVLRQSIKTIAYLVINLAKPVFIIQVIV